MSCFYLFIFVLFIDRHKEIRSRISQVTRARSLLFGQNKSKQAVKKRIIISKKSRFHQGFLRFHQFSSSRNFFLKFYDLCAVCRYFCLAFVIYSHG